MLARHASTVSRLSRGRLIVGIGLGTDESGDLSRFGEPTHRTVRSTMLTEGLAIMRAMWAGNPIAHDGAHYQVHLPATDPNPTPSQSGRPVPPTTPR